MWFFHVAMFLSYHVWLSGSVLVPCMLLARWGAKKWNGLRWLTSSRKRWLLVWAGYGFGKEAVLALLLTWDYSHSLVPPFDYLGWAGMAVHSAINILHVHLGITVEFAVGLALLAVGEAAIDCGLAAIAWWVDLIRGREVHAQLPIERFVICVLLSACTIGIVNSPHFWRSTCSDCFATHGVPFTFFHEGGFAGGEGFVWAGVVGNTVVALALALVLGLVWSRFARRLSSARN